MPFFLSFRFPDIASTARNGVLGKNHSLFKVPPHAYISFTCVLCVIVCVCVCVWLLVSFRQSVNQKRRLQSQNRRYLSSDQQCQTEANALCNAPRAYSIFVACNDVELQRNSGLISDSNCVSRQRLTISKADLHATRAWRACIFLSFFMFVAARQTFRSQ